MIGTKAAPALRVRVPGGRFIEQVVRCLFGLMLFGFGISMIIEAELGAAPWDVFHTGVSEITGVSVGNVVILTGLALLLVWIPLRERPGLGTLLNATVIGVVVDITLPLIPDTSLIVTRSLLMLGGVTVIAVGSGFYIGAGLGPGPRDGLMTGLAKRSIGGRQISVRASRTAVELLVLCVGIALGGSVGIGTAVFVFSIGPLVQVFLPRLTMRLA
ncbi:YitT family protein [Ilumatobacter sp.]|uniref:membrane protein YczE n=1 Tax=Ilumatobacter sp. TaxID=1967498 RepID=UPI002A2E5468|nr:hypothetical protein [Ilumatobacter sp.]